MSGRWGRMSGLAGSSFCDGAPDFRELGPDVRGFRTGRMSGLGGRMSGLAWVFQMHSVMEGTDFRAKADGCPGLREEPDVRGMGPDVRAL